MSKYKYLIYYMNILPFNSLTLLNGRSKQNRDDEKSRKRSGDEYIQNKTGLKNKLRLFFGLMSAPAEKNTTNFVFYYGPSFADSQTYTLSEAKKILHHPDFNLNKKTVLYIPGYLESVMENSVNVIVDAYLERNDYNIVALDWSSSAEGNYIFDVVLNVDKFGPELADVLIQMFNAGLNINKFHLVGHSLGGQLSGIVGREIYKKTNGNLKLFRITALDPAYPGHYFIKFGSPLYRSDAKFIDVIHTDAGFYGVPYSTGTADFWPNGGKMLQPGCPGRNYKLFSEDDVCSHRRSWLYWAESVSGKYELEFNAVKANSWSDFLKDKVVDSQEDVVMGNDCPTYIQGDYYLQTNSVPPFARGLEGKKQTDSKSKCCK